RTIANHLKDRRVIRIAQARCGLDQRIQHPLHIKRRTTDDLQNIGSSGLLLKGLTELVEQARVLDCDYPLLREPADQFDLFVSKWSHFLAVNGDSPEYVILLDHGHYKERPCTGDLS